jgi:hypothetical protein
MIDGADGIGRILSVDATAGTPDSFQQPGKRRQGAARPHLLDPSAPPTSCRACMRSMSSRFVAAFATWGLVMAGCNSRAAPPLEREVEPATSVTSAVATSAAEREPSKAQAPEGLPIPEAVAKLHRGAFASREGAAELGGVLCYVTLHDAALEKGSFYPLVLFAKGSIGTWRHTPAGPQEPFYAQLSAEERGRATELISKIPEGRSLGRERFERSAMVMGVSVRVGDRQETHYFDDARIPDALAQLVGMLKHRLEATNRRP